MIGRNPSKRVAPINHRFGQADSANAIASSSASAVEHEEYVHIVRTPDTPNHDRNAHDLRGNLNPQDTDTIPWPLSTSRTTSPDSCACAYQFPQPPIAVQATPGLLQKRGTLGALVTDIEVLRRLPTEKPRKEVPPGRRGAIIRDIKGPPSNWAKARAAEVAKNKVDRRARTQLRKDQEKALGMLGNRVRRTRKKVGRGSRASSSMVDGYEGGDAR